MSAAKSRWGERNESIARTSNRCTVRSTENKNRKKYRLSDIIFYPPSIIPLPLNFHPIFFILSHILMGLRSASTQGRPVRKWQRLRRRLQLPNISRASSPRALAKQSPKVTAGNAPSALTQPGARQYRAPLVLQAGVCRSLSICILEFSSGALPAEKLAPTLLVNNVSYSDHTDIDSTRRILCPLLLTHVRGSVISRFDFELHNPPTRHVMVLDYPFILW